MVTLEHMPPEDFLNEEIRNGYTITKKMKEVWAVEIDLLLKFDEVCRKHDLQYFAAYGTLIGAVRNKGFIPWDDDIDVLMFREDYLKLCKAADEFKDPYFFQNTYTDRRSLRGHAQLRNSKTTAMLKHEAEKVDFNQGIFIDIFILDAIPDDIEQCKALGEKLNKLRRSTVRVANYERFHTDCKLGLKGYLIKILTSVVSFDTIIKLIEIKRDRLILSNSTKNYKRIGNVSATGYKETNSWNRDLFEKSRDAEFEYIKIKIPEKYDQILTKTYGDYMKPVQAPTDHGTVIFDTNMSYKDYILKNCKADNS